MNEQSKSQPQVSVAALRDRLKRNRYSLEDAYDAVDRAMRKGWNDAMGHVEQLISRQGASGVNGFESHPATISCECDLIHFGDTTIIHCAYCPARGAK
jgi:hypothetical protein